MELQWPLILFTTLLAWAAGLFGAQCLWALRGRGAKAQMPALIGSAALLAVGGIAVFFHLEHWERIFNGFGHMTSGITQELIAIVVLAVVMVVYFVYLRRGGEAKVPAWLSAVGIVVAVVLVVVMGHSYMMASLPAWDSLLQIGSLLGAACAFGPATMALICAVRDEASDLDARANVIGQCANLVLAVAYLVAMQATAGSYAAVEFWFDPTSPTLDITPDGSTAPFAGASVGAAVVAIIAAVVGAASAFIGRAKGDWKVWGAVGAGCVLASAIALRVVFYMTGVSVYPFF